MKILIDSAGLSVADPDDFAGFSVATALGLDELRETVALLGLGRVEGDHVWVDPQAIRGAIGSLTPTWESGFDAMTAFADQHGWIDPEGRIRAHIQTDTEKEHS